MSSADRDSGLTLSDLVTGGSRSSAPTVTAPDVIPHAAAPAPPDFIPHQNAQPPEIIPHPTPATSLPAIASPRMPEDPNDIPDLKVESQIAAKVPINNRNLANQYLKGYFGEGVDHGVNVNDTGDIVLNDEEQKYHDKPTMNVRDVEDYEKIRHNISNPNNPPQITAEQQRRWSAGPMFVKPNEQAAYLSVKDQLHQEAMQSPKMGVAAGNANAFGKAFTEGAAGVLQGIGVNKLSKVVTGSDEGVSDFMRQRMADVPQRPGLATAPGRVVGGALPVLAGGPAVAPFAMAAAGGGGALDQAKQQSLTAAQTAALYATKAAWGYIFGKAIPGGKIVGEGAAPIAANFGKSVVTLEGLGLAGDEIEVEAKRLMGVKTENEWETLKNAVANGDNHLATLLFSAVHTATSERVGQRPISPEIQQNAVDALHENPHLSAKDAIEVGKARQATDAANMAVEKPPEIIPHEQGVTNGVQRTDLSASVEQARRATRDKFNFKNADESGNVPDFIPHAKTESETTEAQPTQNVPQKLTDTQTAINNTSVRAKQIQEERASETPSDKYARDNHLSTAEEYATKGKELLNSKNPDKANIGRELLKTAKGMQSPNGSVPGYYSDDRLATMKSAELSQIAAAYGIEANPKIQGNARKSVIDQIKYQQERQTTDVMSDRELHSEMRRNGLDPSDTEFNRDALAKLRMNRPEQGVKNGVQEQAQGAGGRSDGTQGVAGEVGAVRKGPEENPQSGVSEGQVVPPSDLLPEHAPEVIPHEQTQVAGGDNALSPVPPRAVEGQAAVATGGEANPAVEPANGAASRFSDPNDAADILERFLKPVPKNGLPESPAPVAGKALEAPKPKAEAPATVDKPETPKVETKKGEGPQPGEHTGEPQYGPGAANKTDPTFNINAYEQDMGDSPTRRILHTIGDSVSPSVLPNLERAGVLREAVNHAKARDAVLPVIRGLLSKIFPDSYKNPEEMAKTIDILNKNDILGGYDEFYRRAAEAKAAGNPQGEAAWIKKAEAVEKVHNLNALDKEVSEAENNPVIKSNIDRYKKIYMPRMDQLYNEMKRLNPDEPQETRGRYFGGTRINLISEAHLPDWQKALKDPDRPMPDASAGSYRNPNVKRDQFDQAATFTGKYATDAETVMSAAMARRMNEVTKLRFIEALQRNGAAWEDKPGAARPEKLRGEEVANLPIRVPQTDPETGATRMVERSLYVPKSLVSEIRSVMATDQKPRSAVVQGVSHVLNTIQVTGLVDWVAHGGNLERVVANALGEKGPVADALKKIPGVGTTAAVARTAGVIHEIMSDTPEIRAEMAKMAENGLLRGYYKHKLQVTGNALQMVDQSARVVMNRYFDNLVERGVAQDTFDNRYKFISQVGEYNRRLTGPVTRFMRDLGLSPFAIAGQTFNRMGRRWLMADPGFKANDLQTAIKARSMMAAGLVMATTIPMMINSLTTGNPMGRSGTPLGAIDFGTDDEKGDHKILDLLQLTGARRGIRSLGLNAVIEGLRQGKDWNTIGGNMFHDIVSTALHPWMGPAVAFGIKTATGKQPDLRGQMTANKIPEGGTAQIGENARAALESQNPLIYNLLKPAFNYMGWDKSKQKPYFTNLLMSGAVSPAASAIGYKTSPPASDAAMDMARTFSRDRFGEGMTLQQKEKAESNRTILTQLKANPQKSDEILSKAVDAGTLDDKSAAHLAKKAGTSDLLWNAKQLDVEAVGKIYDAANPAEKKSLEKMLSGKIVNSPKTPAEQDKLFKDHNITPPQDLQFQRDYKEKSAIASQLTKAKGEFEDAKRVYLDSANADMGQRKDLYAKLQPLLDKKNALEDRVEAQADRFKAMEKTHAQIAEVHRRVENGTWNPANGTPERVIKVLLDNVGEEYEVLQKKSD